MKKRNHRNLIKPYFIVVVCIISLNFIGISYAYWNEAPNILNSLSTGLIEPLFCDEYTIDVLQGMGDLEVDIDNPSTLTVRGRVYEDFRANINFCLQNRGSIPMKYAGEQETPDGIVIHLHHPAEIIEPGACCPDSDGGPKLYIQACEAGRYDFEIEMPFQQWNKENVWTKPLFIRGSIEVVQSGPPAGTTQSSAENQDVAGGE